MADDLVGIPDVPVGEISPETMEKLDPKDYIQVRDEQEHLKRHPEDAEPEDGANGEESQRVKRGTPKGIQKRFDKLTRRTYAAETRAEAAERRVVEAEEAWRAAHSLNRSGEELVERAKQQAADEVRQELLRVDEESKDEYNRAADEARSRYRDWEQVVGQNIKIPIRVHNAILEMGKDGPALTYYLGQHPGLCGELMAMKPHAAVARVGRMAAELERAQRERMKPPAPISTVGGSSARSGVPLEEMPIKDFIRTRNAQERARR